MENWLQGAIAFPHLLTRAALLLIPPLIMCFISALASPGQTPEGQVSPIRVEYDEKSDTRRVTLNPIILVSRRHEELRLGAFSSHQGKVPLTPKEVALVFLSLTTAATNKYESARQLTITADENRFGCGETQRTTQTEKGLFMETLMTVVPFETFVKIAQAKEVKLKLGITEVKLEPEHVLMLRAAASYMGK
ncbi:hypothetical protein BH20ACI3_BH20ACI3_25160 [soil metagenome]